MTIQELGKKTKAKYPQYAGMSDDEVGKKVAAKYPQYLKEQPKSESKNIQQQAGGVLNKVGNLFGLRNLQSTINLGILTPGFGAQQQATENLQRAQEVAQRQTLQQAQQAQTPEEKQRLLDTSRRISSEMGQQSEQLGQQSQQLQELGRVSDKDLDRSNLDFALRRGAGSSAELASLLAPQTKALNIGKSAGILQKAGLTATNAAIDSAARSALTTLVDPTQKTPEEAANDIASAAVTSAIISGTLAGGGSLVGDLLKGAGRGIKPKDREVLIKKVQAAKKQIDPEQIAVNKRQGQDLIESQLRVPRALNKRYRTSQTVKELLDDGVDFSGGLDDVYLQAKTVTGGNGVLSKSVRDAIGKVDENIPLDNAQQQLTRSIDDAVVVDDRILNKIKLQVNKILTKNQAGINQTNPLDTFDAIKTLETLEASYNSKVASSFIDQPQTEQIARIYGDVADQLADDLFKKVGKEQVQDVLTAETIDVLQEISPTLAEKALNAKSVADLRAIQAPFVRMSQIIDATRNSQFSTFNQFTNAMQGGPGRLINPVNIATQALGGEERAALRLGTAASRAPVLGNLRQSVGQGVENVGTTLADNEKLQALRRLLSQISGQSVVESQKQGRAQQ